MTFARRPIDVICTYYMRTVLVIWSFSGQKTSLLDRNRRYEDVFRPSSVGAYVPFPYQKTYIRRRQKDALGVRKMTLLDVITTAVCYLGECSKCEVPL